MNQRSYFELLSNRMQARAVPSSVSEPASVQVTHSGFVAGRLIGDRYTPTSRIGRGRLGEIYEAQDAAGRDVGVERRVALQRIDDRIVAEPRLVDELESGYALLRAGTHPNVVKTLDFFRDGKSCYLVMEFLEGLSLRSVLEEAVPEALSLKETASIVRAVGDGLQYLHAKSMVHGDVRPANVFITFDYVVKLLDVAPMSPRLGVPYRVEDAEQGAASRDARDDVYDLACLAYELLSGRHPFNACSPHDAHRAGLKAAPLSDLTVRQWDAIARGLALQRAERTPSVAQFLREFGISGTERLRAPDDAVEAPQAEANAVPLHSPAPEISNAPHSPRDVEAPIRAPRTLRAVDAGREPRRQRQPHKAGGRGVRGVVLFVALVGVGAWAFLNYDELRAGASELIANVVAATAPEPEEAATPGAQPASEAESAAPGRPIGEGELEPPAAEPPAAEPPVEAAATAVSQGSPSAPAEAEAVGRGAAAGVHDAPTPAEAPAELESPAQARDETRSSAPAPTAERSSRPGVASSGPAFRFARPVVTIGEGQTAAALVIERSAAGAPAAIAWWTSDNTAVADEDYADLGQRTERFQAGEQSRTIFVPLVADALPERTESFYVYLGRYDASNGRLQPLSSVRVDIRDDD